MYFILEQVSIRLLDGNLFPNIVGEKFLSLIFYFYTKDIYHQKYDLQ